MTIKQKINKLNKLNLIKKLKHALQYKALVIDWYYLSLKKPNSARRLVANIIINNKKYKCYIPRRISYIK